MADLLDVENALVTLATTAVYPNGTSQPSVANIPIKIFPGWPISANLEADISAGIANVSIFPTNSVRPTTRFDTEWQELSVNAATLSLTVAINTITVGGTVSIPQTCMVINNGTAYPYVVLQNDTLNTIAAGIAALIPGASAVGAVVTITGSYNLIGRIGTTGTSIRELDREERIFKITVWAPNYTARSQIAAAIRIAYSSAVRLTLVDGYYAGLKYSGSHEIDDLQKVKIYRRDLLYAVEFATTQTETDYTITDPYVNVEAGPTGVVTP